MEAEADNYLQRLDDLRGQVKAMIAQLSAEALNWRPLHGTEGEPTNSLAVMAAHIAGAEHFWIGEVIGGRPSTRDREAEFAIVVADGGALVRTLEHTGEETRQVLSALSAGDLDGTRVARGRIVPVRWAILHVVDHSALHLGHMQITYQLMHGGKNVASPLWTERLPGRGVQDVDGSVRNRGPACSSM